MKKPQRDGAKSKEFLDISQGPQDPSMNTSRMGDDSDNPMNQLSDRNTKPSTFRSRALTKRQKTIYKAYGQNTK